MFLCSFFVHLIVSSEYTDCGLSGKGWLRIRSIVLLVLCFNMKIIVFEKFGSFRLGIVIKNSGAV